MTPSVLKNFSVNVLEKGYAGVATSVKLPSLKLKTIEHRAAGMDAAIDVDVGLEKLEAELTLSCPKKELLMLFGQGSVTVRAVGTFIDVLPAGVQVANAHRKVTVLMTGLIKSVEQGEWKVGEQSAETKVSMTLSDYQYFEDGKPIHNINVMLGIRIISGIDQNLAQNLPDSV